MKEEHDQNRVGFEILLGTYYVMVIITIIMLIVIYVLLLVGETEHARVAIFSTVGSVIANILFQRRQLRWLNDDANK